MIDAKEAYNLSKQGTDKIYRQAIKKIEKTISESVKKGSYSCFVIVNSLPKERIEEIKKLLINKGYDCMIVPDLSSFHFHIYWGD